MFLDEINHSNQDIVPEIENKIITENYAIGATLGEIFLDLNEGYGNARIIDDKKNTAIKVQIVTLLELMRKGGWDMATAFFA